MPNSDPTLDDPYFSTFTQIAFAQTMVLFIETVIVLAIWNGEARFFWFLRCNKDEEKLSEEEEDELEERKKVMEEKGHLKKGGIFEKLELRGRWEFLRLPSDDPPILLVLCNEHISCL